VPLSDHEQRLLEQMERALYAEDPKFADALRKSRSASIDRKGIVLGVAGIMGGLAVLVVGVATQIIPLGIIGFVLMLAGAFWSYRAFTRKSEEGQTPADPSTVGRSASRKASSGGFMDRLEQRWQQRRERGQY
jgi:hypothetical protein